MPRPQCIPFSFQLQAVAKRSEIIATNNACMEACKKFSLVDRWWSLKSLLYLLLLLLLVSKTLHRMLVIPLLVCPLSDLVVPKNLIYRRPVERCVKICSVLKTYHSFTHARTHSFAFSSNQSIWYKSKISNVHSIRFTKWHIWLGTVARTWYQMAFPFA